MAHSTAAQNGVYRLPGSLRRCSSTGTPRWCQHHTSRKPPEDAGSDRRRRRTSSSAAAAQQQQLVTEDFKDYILDLQRRIISAAEELDGSGARFVHDRWERDAADPNAGYGITSGEGLWTALGAAAEQSHEYMLQSHDAILSRLSQRHTLSQRHAPTLPPLCPPATHPLQCSRAAPCWKRRRPTSAWLPAGCPPSAPRR